MSSYRFCVTVGVTIFLVLSALEAKRAGLSPMKAIAAYFLSLQCSLLGAKGLSWLIISGASLVHSSSHASMGGVASYGAILVMVPCVWLVCRLLGLPVVKTVEISVPFMALALAVGRIGCLLAGCCYGKPTTCAAGLFFPDLTQAGGTVRHPTQLYMAFGNLFVFLFLKLCFVRRRKPGQTVALFFALHSAMRLAVQPFRHHRPDLAPDMGTGTLMTGLAVLSLTGWVVFFVLGRAGKSTSQCSPESTT